MNLDSTIGLYLITLVAYFFIYNILTWGLNIQFGYAGIPNFTYMTFMAAGAYFSGALGLGPSGAQQYESYVLGLGLPFPITLIGGAVAAAVLGLAVGLVALRRLRSEYLAIVTFSLGFIAYDFVSSYVPLFNGFAGLYGIAAPLNNYLQLDVNTYLYFFAVLSGLVMVITWFVANRIYNSDLGRTLRAIRNDQEAAEALGKNTFRFRLLALVVGCFYAGVGGALTIEFVSAINPSGWTAPETFVIWSAMLVGGRANNLGSVLGAFVVPVLLTEGTRFIPAVPDHPLLIAGGRFMLMGLLIILIMWFRPQGLLPERRRRFYEIPIARSSSPEYCRHARLDGFHAPRGLPRLPAYANLAAPKDVLAVCRGHMTRSYDTLPRKRLWRSSRRTALAAQSMRVCPDTST